MRRVIFLSLVVLLLGSVQVPTRWPGHQAKA
jgi:hypothetical protein